MAGALLLLAPSVVEAAALAAQASIMAPANVARRNFSPIAGPLGDLAGYRTPPIYEQPQWWSGEVVSPPEDAEDTSITSTLTDPCWWATEECDVPLEPSDSTIDDVVDSLFVQVPCITTGEGAVRLSAPSARHSAHTAKNL